MERPKELIQAKEKLEKLLNIPKIGSAYGMADYPNKNISWFLIVWSDDNNLIVPDVFEGYAVRKRGVPRAL